MSWCRMAFTTILTIPQGPGDLWFFPPGFPHSLQAKNTTSDGAEFLLIFDNGSFSEDSTFLLTVCVFIISVTC